MELILNIALIGLLIFIVAQRLLPTSGVRQITTEELKQELSNKSNQYIDVRTPMEYKGNQIKGFKNIPLFDLNKRSAEIDKEKPVYVICQSGMRSNKASKLLKKLGYSQITNVKGGMSTWR